MSVKRINYTNNDFYIFQTRNKTIPEIKKVTKDWLKVISILPGNFEVKLSFESEKEKGFPLSFILATDGIEHYLIRYDSNGYSILIVFMLPYDAIGIGYIINNNPWLICAWRYSLSTKVENNHTRCQVG